jgi:hypothetical protein
MDGGHHPAMGRIGRSYPRFEQPQKPSALPAQEEGISPFQVAGALIGVLSALGFIGWLLTR